MFQIFQLRCFVAVATELHFGRAAKRLYITQAPLSRQIQGLEHTLGVTLLARTRRFVQLTPAGLAFLPEAEHILLSCEMAAVAARRASQGEAGNVRLGFIPVSRFKTLPDIVSSSRTGLADINLELKEKSTLEQTEALISRRLDLGLVRPERHTPGLETICLLNDPFVLALHVDHPLAKVKDVSILDLDKQPFIMYSPSEGHYSFEILSGVFRAGGVRPDYIQFLYQTHTILSLVNIGLGAAIVPRTAELAMPEFVVLKNIDLGGASAELHLAWRKGETDPAINRCREFIARLFDKTV